MHSICRRIYCGENLAFTSSHPYIHSRIKEISSPLPALVAIITVPMWLAYFIVSRTPRYSDNAQFIKLAATAIPAAFLTKTFLQHAFGRTGPRSLLQDNYHSVFKWFKIEGCFPSGHTIILTALLTAIWLYFPRCRLLTIALFSGLTAALLLSSYHFVSDIIAGAILRNTDNRHD